MQNMEQEGEILMVQCRDGITARVQRVPYAGEEGGEVTFGYRIHPILPRFDKSGNRNEGPDIWYQDGHWLETMQQHPFDIVKILKAVANTIHTTPSHA